MTMRNGLLSQYFGRLCCFSQRVLQTFVIETLTKKSLDIKPRYCFIECSSQASLVHENGGQICEIS